MTDLTHNPDHYPHKAHGNADLDLLCQACEAGAPRKRAMPGPPEPVPHDFDTLPHKLTEDPWDYCPGCAAQNRMRLVDPKRLADAEAAAEYWRAEAEEADARGRSWFYEDPATVNAERLKASLAADRARTWHRLATLPHALEVEA